MNEFNLFMFYRNLYLTFTNILTVISQNAEVGIPKPFELKVKGWLGNNEEVFKQAHNQVSFLDSINPFHSGYR